MDILGLLREYLEIRQDRKDHCKSCLILQEQLSRALDRESRLLASLTSKSEPVRETPAETPMPLQTGKTIPWHIKRQLLEAEDRAKALALRDLANATSPTVEKKPIESVNTDISVDELEKELGIGGQ